MDKKKRTIIDHYQHYWLTRVPIYGFTEYHKEMLEIVNLPRSDVTRNRVLECAVGTGFPAAIQMSSLGWDVHGVDIGEVLIKKCRENAEESGVNVTAVVGDVENLPYKDATFNLVYCFQSTWYFSHLGRAIREMIRVTAPQGIVLFDIRNGLNPEVIRHYLKRRLPAVLKDTSNFFSKRSYNSVSVEVENVAFAVKVRRILAGQDVEYSTRVLSRDWKPPWLGKAFAPRLVYIVRKGRTLNLP